MHYHSVDNYVCHFCRCAVKFADLFSITEGNRIFYACELCYTSHQQPKEGFQPLAETHNSLKKDLEKDERINHPAHYTRFSPEVIQIIENYQLGYHLGNVIKYLLRSPFKGRQLEDLQKARWYLDRLIANLTSPPSADTSKDASGKPAPNDNECAAGSIQKI